MKNLIPKEGKVVKAMRMGGRGEEENIRFCFSKASPFDLQVKRAWRQARVLGSE
jgi:hypothetical protein